VDQVGTPQSDFVRSLNLERRSVQAIFHEFRLQAGAATALHLFFEGEEDRRFF
jgi:hypothetical protein